MKCIESKLIEIIDKKMDYFGNDKHNYIADYWIFLGQFREEIMKAFKEENAERIETCKKIEHLIDRLREELEVD